MNKSPDTVTLCTYTYNDQDLLLGLLRNVSTWTIQPDEIIIIDDGSDVPLVLDTKPPNTRIVRLEANMGLGHAKNLGPDLAASKYILSMDSDTRLCPEWLERCLPHAANQHIGIVGGMLVHQSGDDIVSRYLAHFGDNHNVDADGPVDFLPGNARLIRADVWRQVGGLSGHVRRICEDRFLCVKMKAHGLLLYVEKLASAFQVRRLSRSAMVKRFYDWDYMAHTRNLPQEEYFPDYVYHELVLPFMKFYVHVAELDEPAFIYLNFLIMAYTVSHLLEYAVANLGYSRELEQGWRQALAGYLDRYPEVLSLLSEDVHRDGSLADARPGEPDTASPWSRCFTMLRILLREGGIWSRMEQEGVSRLRHEDATIEHDFSFHLAFDPEEGS